MKPGEQKAILLSKDKKSKCNSSVSLWSKFFVSFILVIKESTSIGSMLQGCPYTNID